MKTIFVVDDSDANLVVAENALEGLYRVMTLPSAAKMFSLLQKVTPDIILLDINMPGEDGFCALKQLKSTPAYADIPVIFLTALSDPVAEAEGFHLGAIDFITKPFSAPVLQNRVRSHLDINELIRERTEHIERLQNGIIMVLADVVENRDHSTGGHIERTTIYVKMLLDGMMARGAWSDAMRNWDTRQVASAARLHDVGKIAIPDNILNKPGPLDKAEFAIIQTHVAQGEKIVDQIIARTGDMDFIQNARLFVGYHHEQWGGGGYPRGLAGGDIPLPGRVMAIVDVFDALVSERPYKRPIPPDAAVDIIMADAGTRFDPAIAEIFYGLRDQLKEAMTAG